MVFYPPPREGVSTETPKPFIEGIFGAAVDPAGLRPKSTLNPLGMANNCVSVTLARLLGLKDCIELWDIAGVTNREDKGLDEEEIHVLLRKLGKTFAFQVNPPRMQIETAFMQVNAGFDVDEVGIAYLRSSTEGEDISQGHCVVYRRDRGLGFSIFSDDSTPYKGQFVDYQTDFVDPNLQDEVVDGSVRLAFICADVQVSENKKPGTLISDAGEIKYMKYSEISDELRRRVISGDDEGAKTAVEEQVRLYDSYLLERGPEDDLFLESELDLAALYYIQKRPSEALPHQEHYINTKRRLLGLEHPDTLAAYVHLALTAWDLGSHQNAILFAASARVMAEKALGPDHEVTLMATSELVRFRMKEGSLNLALQLCVPVVEGKRKLLGDDHEQTISSLTDLASIYEGLAMWTDVATVEEELLSATVKDVGDEHPSAISHERNLGFALVMQGRDEQAEKLLVHVYEVLKKDMGADHKSTLNMMGNLIQLYLYMKRLDDAEKLRAELYQLESTRTWADDYEKGLDEEEYERQRQQILAGEDIERSQLTGPVSGAHHLD